MGGLRLIFMGTPDFAVSSLAALAAAGHSVVAVYSQPPRPAGRGQKERPSPVHAWADAHGIAVRTPRSLRDPTEQRLFAELAADAAVVAAYGLILPKPILDAPRLGCFNVHASLLPRWRGAAPIQRAIMAGDAVSGVTIMRMEEGLDTGPMLLAHSLPITPQTTGGALHDALAAMGARLIVEALAGVVAGILKAQPQPAEGVTYAAKLGKDDGRLDWQRPAEELARLVRALAPQPAAWFARGGERFKVLDAEPAEGQGRPGEVLDGRLTVACGSGALRLTRVQRAGKAAMDAEALLRGYALPAGSVLD